MRSAERLDKVEKINDFEKNKAYWIYVNDRKNTNRQMALIKVWDKGKLLCKEG